MERNDTSARFLEKEINKEKEVHNLNSNQRVSSVTKLNISYLKDFPASNFISSNNNNNILSKTYKEKLRMNKSINNYNNISNLNERNSPFQFIKTQLAYKHYEILYKPKHFKAGFSPVDISNDYTSLQFVYTFVIN